MSLDSLRHVERALPDLGSVIILDTGAVITAEDRAMLQALHSRSVGGLRHHLGILAKKGSGGLMQTYYVGYGDKSIGDCGTTEIFIEGVSMLVAKAIQDWMLYSGQESSTRYIDFAKQHLVNPLGSAEGEVILEAWRDFYVRGLSSTIEDVERRFPRQEGEDEKLYEKAVKARAFDIMRGFLPAGASTNLSWETNLRQASDHIMLLRHHPLLEVRNVAEAMEDALREAHPNSFNQKKYEATEDYNAWWMKNEYYFNKEVWVDFRLAFSGVDTDLLRNFRETLERRPPKTEIPKKVGVSGTVRFEFMLDFGSFRDLQRHRSIIQMMPRVTTSHGFHSWYLSELPTSVREEAKILLREQDQRIAALNATDFESQYYIPMGYILPNQLSVDIPALVYIVELRSTRFVHPTLRQRARQMGYSLLETFGAQGLKIHFDPEPDRFDIRRGSHDIVMKE